MKINYYKRIFSLRRSKIWLSGLWLSLALYLFIVRVTNWVEIEFIQSYAVCAFTYPTRKSRIVHSCITVGLLFVLPLCIGIFSYPKIFKKTHEHQQNVVPSLQNNTDDGAVRNSVKEIKLTRMLLFVGAGFLCCWMPMWAMVLWFRFSPETFPRIAILLLIFLLFLSASVNPIIYTFKNGELRREFHKTALLLKTILWNEERHETNF